MILKNLNNCVDISILHSSILIGNIIHKFNNNIICILYRLLMDCDSCINLTEMCMIFLVCLSSPFGAVNKMLQSSTLSVVFDSK